jgi:hypothetical protein
MRSFVLVMLLTMLGVGVPVGRASAESAPSAPAPEGALVFAETGPWLAGSFRTYWEAGGGLKQFGYPISPPVRDADGRTVQWLQRARLEQHEELPKGRRVLLGLLGREVTQGREQEPPFARIGDPADGSWFPATGHTLRGEFRRIWQLTGGLAVYGYPISEEFDEVNPSDGRTYTVQYFERNRFEWHPELPAAFRVTFGLLGIQLYPGGGEVVPPVPDDAPPAVAQAPVAAGGRVTAIGDSVMLGAASALRQTLGDVDVDATVSRQMAEVVGLAQAKRATGALGPVVVIHVGNNGGITAGQFDQLMTTLAGARRVVVLTLKVPRVWEAGNNAIIRAGVPRYSNAVLVDWQTASASRSDYFWADGIHLRPAGAQAYAALVAPPVNAARDA